MSYQEPDYLQLSGLQHFVFCRRQWALIHIEDQWQENLRTTEGKIMHEKAHDETFRESRGDRLILRGVRISSATLGVSGQCDVLEYHRSETGIQIVCFSYAGASPALMGACAEREIGLSLCTPRGKFLARVTGSGNGNVLLRREQYRIADDSLRSCKIARCSIFGKLYNSRKSIERTLRDHKMRINEEEFRHASERIQLLLPQVLEEISLDSLRGLEGVGASVYFGIFDDMILREKEQFFFHGRNRRPPLDKVNAMLSFAYSLLANDCASALESVGLDSYVGFFHQDRPGRKSLALDMMEELRPCMADRFVITLINNRMVAPTDFSESESGAVRLTDDGRRIFLKVWQERKREEITHPYLQEKLPWGMVPYVQALLLARYIRGDLDDYPAFLWK